MKETMTLIEKIQIDLEFKIREYREHQVLIQQGGLYNSRFVVNSTLKKLHKAHSKLLEIKKILGGLHEF